MKLNIHKAPPVSVVLPHYAFGAISFFVMSVLMFLSADAFLGHYFNPKLLAITHIAVLGWGTMIIFGSLYQLLPVILNVPLYSSLLAKITFYFFACGIIALVYSFWVFSTGLHLQCAAVMLLIAASFFLINVILTILKVKKLNTESEFILTASIWFWVTVLIGVLMAFNFSYVFLPKENLFYLKLHAHIGIAGWFLLLIMGVGSKLIPMFLLPTKVSNKKLSYAYYFVNAALIGFFADTIFSGNTSRALLYLAIALTGLVFFVSFVFEAFKNRVRKKLDIGMKQTFYAFIIASMAIVFSILNNLNLPELSLRITMVFGYNIFIGYISLLILGQTVKTLPFIVWLHRYQHLASKANIPMPKDLFSEKIGTAQFIVFIIAYCFMITGIFTSTLLIIRIACLFLIFAALLYNFNVFKIIFHKHK